MPRGVKPERRVKSGVRAFLGVKEGSLRLPEHPAGDDEKDGVVESGGRRDDLGRVGGGEVGDLATRGVGASEDIPRNQDHAGYEEGEGVEEYLKDLKDGVGGERSCEDNQAAYGNEEKRV